MMISPETFYTENLEGKNSEEIMRQIRSLKKEINKLKKDLESNCSETDAIIICPSPLTRIKVYQDYLDRAKQALDESGAKYEPTLPEKREMSFNELLEFLKNIFFYIEGLNSVNESVSISFSRDAALYSHSFFNNPEKMEWTLTKEDVIDAFTDMHIGEWKRDYYNREKFDGIRWCLEIEYFGHRSVRISGSNSFPYNFNELLEFLEIET